MRNNSLWTDTKVKCLEGEILPDHYSTCNVLPRKIFSNRFLFHTKCMETNGLRRLKINILDYLKQQLGLQNGEL